MVLTQTVRQGEQRGPLPLSARFIGWGLKGDGMGDNAYSESARESKRAYYLKNREAILALRRVKYSENPKKHMGKAVTPEQIVRRNQRSKAWRLANQERYSANKKARYQKTKHLAWRRNLLNKYGITVEAYEAMLLVQENRCAICRNVQTRRRLNVDHCHQTGVVRGLLCDKCNKAIGLFGDSMELINRVIEYLAAYGRRNS